MKIAAIIAIFMAELVMAAIAFSAGFWFGKNAPIETYCEYIPGEVYARTDASGSVSCLYTRSNIFKKEKQNGRRGN